MSAIQLSTRPDSVAALTFDQPGSKANVLTADLWTELEAVFDSLASRTDLRGLVLASAKPGIFIAGADLNVLMNAPGPNDPAVRGFIEQGLRVLDKLESLPFPTCAAIDGAALGGGLEVALACDFRCVGENPKVRLGLPEVTLGLIPGWGGTQRLSRCSPTKFAAEMLVTGRSVTAAEADGCGLAHAAPSDGLIDWAAQYILAGAKGHSEPWPRGLRRIPEVLPIKPADFPTPDTHAAREALRVLIEGSQLPVAEGIKLETEAFMQLAGSDESKRLIAAFFASRKK